MAEEIGSRLIWLDLEMTGLDPGRDSILEIATIVTDAELTELAPGEVVLRVLRQPRVVGAGDRRVVRQRDRDRSSGSILVAGSHAERADPAQRAVRVVW